MHQEPPGPPPERRRRPRRKPAVIQLRDFCTDCVEDIPLLTRIASHVGLILLMVFTIAASNVQFNANGDDSELASLNLDDESPFQETEEPADITEVAGLTIPVVLPVANIPKRTRAEVAKYTVQPGDTRAIIAAALANYINAHAGDFPGITAVAGDENIFLTGTAAMSIADNGDGSYAVSAASNARRPGLAMGPGGRPACW